MFYESGDITIYYEEIGTGTPMLCLHGYHMTHHLMTGCMEPALSQHRQSFRRIYIDLPGMGKSPAAPSIKNADDMLRALKGFIAAVLPGENFLLAGESYGGYLALGLVREMPDLVCGLFLICPVVQADFNSRTLPVKNLTLIDEDLTAENAEELSDDLVVISDETVARYQAEIEPGLQSGDEAFLENYQQNGYAFSFENELKDIKYHKPAVILLGRQDDVVGYADMHFLLQNFAHATFAVIDAAGHNMQIDQREIFDAHLKSFLQRTSHL